MEVPPIGAGAKLLVVRDAEEPPYEALFADSEVIPHARHTRAEALADARGVDGALVALDWTCCQTGAPATDLVAQLVRFDVPVVLIADAGAIDDDEAREMGASAVVLRPSDAGEMLFAVRRALMLAYGERDPSGIDNLIGDSRAMKRVRDLIKRAAPGNATILVRGETGSGKELVARAIHEGSERAAGPMITVHCAALPETLLESELFGYEKGAFTGANAQKLGRLERANGGTLFLDEIGDISAATQVKLLRVLQSREFERLGGTTPVRVDVRIVAATHRDLESMVKEGTFREDLFYRLNVVPLWVPPLRARRGDVEVLAQHFCGLFANSNNKPGMTLDDSALKVVREKRWPGNVRQLQNFIERLVVLSSGVSISATDIEREVADTSPFATEATGVGSTASIASTPSEGDVVMPLDEAVRRAEQRALRLALKAADGNRSKAARLLGVSRATLYNRLKEYGLG